MRLIAIATMIAFACSATAHAQSSDPSWLDDLNFQIEAEKGCKVSWLVRVHEGELGGRKTYEARIRCQDGRMFDAQRIGEGEAFTFKSCEIQTC